MLEYLEDGDLHKWRTENWALQSVEDSIRLFCVQLLAAIIDLQSLGVLHRDIKPQNVLLRRSALWTAERSRSTLLAYEPVLADFGTAAKRDTVDAEEFHNYNFQTFAGTHVFMAPEIMSGGKYTSLADVWSLGVLILLLYVGKVGNAMPPLQILAEHRDSMSPEFASALSAMLQPEHTKRISWKQLPQHPWFLFSQTQALELLEASEAHNKFDALIRPAKIENRHLSFGHISRIPRYASTQGTTGTSSRPSPKQFTPEEILDTCSLDSADGRIFQGLIEAREICRSTISKMSDIYNSMRSSNTSTLTQNQNAEKSPQQPVASQPYATEKSQIDASYSWFYHNRIRPWESRQSEVSQILDLFEPFRQVCTQRTILKISDSFSYGMPKARMLLAIEVAKNSMDVLKNLSSSSPSPGVAAHSHQAPRIGRDLQTVWVLLFEESRRAVDKTMVADPDLSTSPVNIFPANVDIPFYAIMHATCVLKYKECTNWLVPLIQGRGGGLEDEADDLFIESDRSHSHKSLDEVLTRLKELRLVMEHVRATLPRDHAAGTPSVIRTGSFSLRDRSSSSSSVQAPNTASPGISTVQVLQSASSGSIATATNPSASSVFASNEAVCMEFIECVSRVIERLRPEMEHILAMPR